MIHQWGCEANLVAVHSLQDITDLKSFPFEAYDLEVPDPAAEDLVVYWYDILYIYIYVYYIDITPGILAIVLGNTSWGP